MDQPALNVGIVDIGTNSMRLLIASSYDEAGRWVEVTGLGRGVDATGSLSSAAVARTIEALGRFGHLMDEHDVVVRKAIATSASRDATNREEFFDMAESALGVRPTLVSGDEEASYAFRGATLGRAETDGLVVVDIGGGSTEFVTDGYSKSIDIGSVRLTDRHLPDLPPSGRQLERAVESARESLFAVDVEASEAIGIAGTWTSLAAIDAELPSYDREAVDGHRIQAARLRSIIDDLARMRLEEVEAIPSLDPARAPFILAGAIIAEATLVRIGVEEVAVSEKDTLDGVAAELLDLP